MFVPKEGWGGGEYLFLMESVLLWVLATFILKVYRRKEEKGRRVPSGSWSRSAPVVSRVSGEGLRWGFQIIPRIARDIQGGSAPLLPKFMQTLNESMYKELERLAKKRGVTVQELIRAVILPEWMSNHERTQTVENSQANR